MTQAGVLPPALKDLPPFPPVAARLMHIVSREEPSFRDLANLIRADVAFSAEVLRLANSSLFSFRYEIVDIPHAIAVLGLNRLIGMVMTVAMRKSLLGSRQSKALTCCWRHSLACALGTELLAEASLVDKGLGYTAGLLHDIGMLALVACNSDAYAELLGSNDDAAALRQCEQELLDLDHCEAGRWLLEDWELPMEFRQVAARHHDPPREDDLEITDLVRKGCQMAGMAGFTVCGEAPPWDAEAPLEWLREAARDRYREAFEALPLAIAAKINSFDCDFLT